MLLDTAKPLFTRCPHAAAGIQQLRLLALTAVYPHQQHPTRHKVPCNLPNTQGCTYNPDVTGLVTFLASLRTQRDHLAAERTSSMQKPTMRFCTLIVRSSTTSGSFRLRCRALFAPPRSSSVAATEGGGEGLVGPSPCKQRYHPSPVSLHGVTHLTVKVETCKQVINKPNIIRSWDPIGGQQIGAEPCDRDSTEQSVKEKISMSKGCQRIGRLRRNLDMHNCELLVLSASSTPACTLQSRTSRIALATRAR